MKILKCSKCGKVIFVAVDSKADVICCGEVMAELVANTVDAAKEKHVPVISGGENKITVTVGSVSHPMTQEHHIAFIAVEQNGKIQIAKLDETGIPEADFNISDGDFTVYEYCNLHGLWSAKN